MQDPRLTNLEPSEYTSIRITIKHDVGPAFVAEFFKDEPWYICYPHNGKNGDNEHYHVFVSATTVLGRQKYRDRLKRAHGPGNKFFSLKHCKNGISCAIQYGSKEGTEPITRGDVQSWIELSPAWLPGVAGRKRKRCITADDAEGDEFTVGVPLNKYNIVAHAARVYKKRKFTHKSFRRTLLFMLSQRETYNWQLVEKLDDMCVWYFLLEIGDDEAAERVINCLLGPDFSIPN